MFPDSSDDEDLVKKEEIIRLRESQSLDTQEGEEMKQIEKNLIEKDSEIEASEMERKERFESEERLKEVTEIEKEIHEASRNKDLEMERDYSRKIEADLMQEVEESNESKLDSIKRIEDSSSSKTDNNSVRRST